MVDFGLSNISGEGETLKTACGSPCYAAPEMVSGKRYNGLYTDIWSCGIILYAMICGFLPFEDPNTHSLYQKIMNSDLHIPTFVSDAAKSLLRGILNKVPEKRLTIQQIRQHEFNIFYGQQLKRGVIWGVSKVELDEEVLKQLENYDIKPEECRQMVLNNKHNQITASYYLLLNRKQNAESGAQQPAKKRDLIIRNIYSKSEHTQGPPQKHHARHHEPKDAKQTEPSGHQHSD